MNSYFKFSHEKLQDQSIISLSRVDQMLEDFKAEVPDNDWLLKLFANLGGGMKKPYKHGALTVQLLTHIL